MSDLREKLESAKSGAESLYAFCEGEWYQDLAKAIRDTLADVISARNRCKELEQEEGITWLLDTEH